MGCVALSCDGGNNEGSRKIWRGEAGQTMDRSGLQCEMRSVACVVCSACGRGTRGETTRRRAGESNGQWAMGRTPNRDLPVKGSRPLKKIKKERIGLLWFKSRWNDGIQSS